MSDFYCSGCGRRIFRSKDASGPEVIYRAPGYECAVYYIKDESTLAHLTHRNGEILPEVWSCCRITAMRRGSGRIVAFADELVESVEGFPPPAPLRLHFSRDLGAADFDEVMAEGSAPVERDKLYVVKFTALWCPPCRAMDRVFRCIARGGLDPLLALFEVDADLEQELSDVFLPPSLPYIVFYKGGKRLNIAQQYFNAVNGGLADPLSLEKFLDLCSSVRESH